MTKPSNVIKVLQVKRITILFCELEKIVYNLLHINEILNIKQKMGYILTILSPELDDNMANDLKNLNV